MKKNELHVLYVLTKLELGGAQKICLSLLNGLEQEGHHGFLISGADGPLVKEVQKKETVYLLPSFKREVSLKNLWSEYTTFIKLYKHIRALRRNYPDLIVHTHSTKAGILGRWAAFFAGVKKRVHTIHGYAFHAHQSWPKWLLIYTVELVTSFITTHFICVSSVDVKTGIKLFPLFTRKHSIIRAAVDWEQFYIPAQATTIKEQNQFIIGTVACFKKQKNIFDLLKAFKYAYDQNNNLRLEIIGDGKLRPLIETWIRELDFEEVITLHGWQDEVARFMQTWHAFALSSLWEGLPCAVVEARLQKLPVLAYDTGGIHDVIFHGENGLLYRQKEWQKLGQGMLDLSKDKETYEKLVHFHDEDLMEFNNQFMVEKHIELYEKL